MTTYVFVTVDVPMPRRFAACTTTARPSVQKFGGQYIVRGRAYDVLEGNFFVDRVAAMAWYESQEYVKAKTLRDDPDKVTFVMVDGV